MTELPPTARSTPINDTESETERIFSAGGSILWPGLGISGPTGELFAIILLCYLTPRFGIKLRLMFLEPGPVSLCGVA